MITLVRRIDRVVQLLSTLILQRSARQPQHSEVGASAIVARSSCCRGCNQLCGMPACPVGIVGYYTPRTNLCQAICDNGTWVIAVMSGATPVVVRGYHCGHPRGVPLRGCPRRYSPHGSRSRLSRCCGGPHAYLTPKAHLGGLDERLAYGKLLHDFV